MWAEDNYRKLCSYDEGDMCVRGRSCQHTHVFHSAYELYKRARVEKRKDDLMIGMTNKTKHDQRFWEKKNEERKESVSNNYVARNSNAKESSSENFQLADSESWRTIEALRTDTAENGESKGMERA